MTVKVRVKRRRRVSYAAAIEAELKQELTRVGQDMAKDMERDVRGWKHRPRFGSRSFARAGKFLVTTFVFDDEAGKIYNWVDLGTKPHDIPKRADAKTLKFQVPSTPKTVPMRGGRAARGGARRTIFWNWRRKGPIKHPGTVAREFSKIRADEWRKKMSRRVDAAVKRGRRRTEAAARRGG